MTESNGHEADGSDNKGLLALARETTLDSLQEPEKVVGFIEQILALGERHRTIASVLPSQAPPTFQDLQEYVESGKFDRGSADFANEKLAFLETAALFPHDARFQAFRSKNNPTILPQDVSIKGIIEGLEFARWERDKKIDLRGVDLSFMDLSHYCLFDSDLSTTNLDNALLRHADLVNANLSSANLTEADLSFADLTGADLTGAQLKDAIFHGAKVDPANAELIRLAGGSLEARTMATS